MPITITPTPPLNHVGPGLLLKVDSDFIGPLPAGSGFFLEFSTDSEGANQIGSMFLEVPGTPHTQGAYMLPGTVETQFGQFFQVADGATAHVTAKLLQGGVTEVDSGSLTSVWDNQAGMPNMVQTWGIASTGFTESDRTELATVISNTQTTVTTAAGVTTQSVGQSLAARAIDTLTAHEITAGPTSGPVTDNLTAFIWGILVRITTIPAAFAPVTPDQAWFYPDLAVVRIFRGDDIHIRQSVHTPSAVVDLKNDKLSLVVTALEVAVWPAALTVEVDFALGVEGQVYKLILP